MVLVLLWIDTVSGATCSSKAIKDACQKAFNAAKK
ncbi:MULTISPECIES: FMN-binding protein [Anaerobutyricum]|uniref:FMN-binding protein n=1 Tax=Anaerobutyricum soehngenii TaxID=105843 RepID=A0A6N7Y9B5_9FIRM|nr:FMN-binding protein [Anaerobutyricum soehngenii]